jgi:PKD-like domain
MKRRNRKRFVRFIDEIFEDTKMRKIRYEFLIIAGLIMTLGAATVFADGKKGKKDDLGRVPKDRAEITVKTSEVAYPVKIDGQYVGMSGVDTAARFDVDPDMSHTVEIEGPAGTIPFRKEIQSIRKGTRECICLKTVTRTISKACPYNIRLEGPETVQEGEEITFTAFNASSEAPVPLRYKWSVSNGTITSGQGTSAITVKTTGMGSQTVNAELDVNDDVYSDQCRQIIKVPTYVTPPPPPITITKCDEVVTRSHDDDKARLDNCVIQVQNSPDAQLYLIIYQGTDKASTTRNSYDSMRKRALQYLVNVRGLDPNRIQIVRGPDRAKTTYEMYIVPPGAQPPVPN